MFLQQTRRTSVQLPISPTDLRCIGRATWPRQSCQPVCCAVDQRYRYPAALKWLSIAADVAVVVVRK